MNLKAGATVDLVLLCVCVSWAATHSMIKHLLSVMSPFGMTAARFLLMMALGAAILIVSRAKFDRRDWPRLVLIAMLSYGIYQFAYVLSIDKGGAFISGVLISMVPVFTIAIGAATRIERPTRPQVVGILLAVACAIGFVTTTRVPTGGSFAGAALSLVAALLFAGYGIAVKPLAGKYPTWSLISLQALLGGVPLVAAGIPSLAAQDWSLITGTHVALILILAVIPAFASYAAWNWAIHRVGAARTSTYALLVPVLASVISLVALREPWSLGSVVFAAGLLVSLGITRL